MSESRTFKCPSCGSPLSSLGDAAQVTCPACGNTVGVPEEMRTRTPHAVIISTEMSSSNYAESVSTRTSSGGGWIVIVGVVIVLAIIGGIMALSSAGSPVAQLNIPVATPTPAGFAHVVLSFGGEGTAPGLFQSARHIGIDPDGNMYVDEQKSWRIQKFDPSGKFVNSWTLDKSACSNKSASPNRIETDRSGNAYIEMCGSIFKYAGTNGQLLGQFNGDNNSPRGFYLDITSYPEGGLLVTTDEAPLEGDAYLRLDYDGHVKARLANLVSAQTNDSANGVTLKPAVDGLGNLFILNNADNAVYKFTSDGKFVNKFGSVGKGAGQFDAMTLDIAVDNQSRVYVTDFAGIKVFDSNGAYIDSMSDRFIGGIDELKIANNNDIYIVGSKSMIYKLVLNSNWNPSK